MLERMRFGSKWIRWINWCISTASFSVMINGSPSGFFRSSRGLRQGDPLSPYLFVIGMEFLSCLLKRAVEGNFISGCRFGGRDGGEIVVSYLLYADDTIIFYEANPEQLMYLRWTLMWFEAFSGLKINTKWDYSTDFLMHFPFRISQCCFPFSVDRMDLKILKIFFSLDYSFNPYGRGQNQVAATTPPMAAARTKPRL